MRKFFFAALVAIGASTLSARAAQNELVPPTSGVFSGVQYSQKLGDAFRSLASCNKGASAPANVGASAVDGLCWIDDSGSPWIIKRYVNGGWAVEGALDPTDSSYIGIIGGGIASLSSASTVDLGSVPQANVTITGTTTVAGFGSAAPAGIEKTIRFNNTLTLTNSAALKVPGGFDLVTAADDRAKVTHLGSGNWEITQYTRASGVPIDVSAVGKPDFTFSEGVPALHLRGDGSAIARTSYPAYFAKVTRAQNGTRTSGNATITGIANTAGFGAGMPVEGTGIGASCTIASFVANTSITLNSGACVTASGTSSVRVFLTGYGVGGTTATVGLPGCEGRMIAGRDPTGANITSAGSGINAVAFNATGGTQNKTLLRSNLPNVAPTFTGIQQGVNSNNTNVNLGGGPTGGIQPASGTVVVLNGVTQGQVSFTFTPSGTVESLNGNVAQTSVNGMPPTLIADCVVRVIP